MSSTVETGYARSEALQQEWETLRQEMERVVAQLSRRHNDKHAMRKVAIEERMSAITAEMSQMLSAAKKEAPMSYQVPEDDSSSSIEEEDQSSIRTDGTRARHEVMRTYESTDSDGEISAEELRARMRRAGNGAHAETVTIASARKGFGFGGGGGGGGGGAVDSEDDAGGGAGRAGGVGKSLARLRGLKTVLRYGAGAGGAGAADGSPTLQTRTRDLTEDECDELRLERGRLEREARKLKRKKDRTEEDDEEAARIARRLSDIGAQLESGLVTETVTPPAGGAASGRRGKGGAYGASSPGTASAGNSSAGSSANLPSVMSAESFDVGAPSEDEEEYMAPKSKAWLALEGSVASVRAFGKMKLKNGPGGGGAGAGDGKDGDGGGGRRRFKAPSGNPLKDGAPAGSAFAQVTDKLTKRGEKLSALNTQAEEMNNNANDMLSAAAALRKRQEKSNSIFR